jgi:hypothetical protein
VYHDDDTDPPVGMIQINQGSSGRQAETVTLLNTGAAYTKAQAREGWTVPF